MESPPPAARPSSSSSEAVRPRCSHPLPSSLFLLLLSLSPSSFEVAASAAPPLLSVVSSPHRMKEKVTCPPEECTLHVARIASAEAFEVLRPPAADAYGRLRAAAVGGSH